MPRSSSARTALLAYLAAFSGVADAFWRLPCRGRAGAARIDPLVDPGLLSYHVHSIHGSSGFSLAATEADLMAGDCTSCAVKQDRSAYWFPSLYFLHANGTAEMAEQEGGMLAYYLLYGENIKAFPLGFRMIAGDTHQRNFTWPIPDPPKSEWSGDQESQTALRQKALGFNCMNYQKPGADEGTLMRHYFPDKAFLDANCPDGLRVEVMFPSCWNGKDVDSPDHKSHMAYPSLVMDGTCPEGYEQRVPSLLYEIIWNTYAFKGMDGQFVLSNGDPTGFGSHGDFMQGWEPGVLQQAVDVCTNLSGEVTDCPVFDLQPEEDQTQCQFPMPDELKDEDVFFHDGLPGGVMIQSGPAYAFPVQFTTSPTAPGVASPTEPPAVSVSLGPSVALGAKVVQKQTPTPTPPPAPAPTPTPVTSYIEGPVTQVIIEVQREIIINWDGQPIGTATGSLSTVGTSSTIVTRTVSTVVTMETPSPQKRDVAGHLHRRGHGHGHMH